MSDKQVTETPNEGTESETSVHHGPDVLPSDSDWEKSDPDYEIDTDIKSMTSESTSLEDEDDRAPDEIPCA